MRSTGKGLLRVLVCLAMLSLAPEAPIADELQGFERWHQHDERSAMQVDHAPWEAFLLNYLRPGADGVHRVAYGEVNARDRRALSSYVDAMGEVDIAAYRRPEQMAYWINLYNALMVKLVLDHYPIASLRKLERPGAGSKSSPWNRPLIVIDRASLSLNDIEHRILKPIWNDPRIHYAITCAAVGCPNLQPIPFSGRRLDQQLSDAAMAYVNDPRCIEIENGELHVSSLYRWNFQAFGGSERAIIQHLMAYAEPELAMSLQSFDRLHGDRFDWRLNDAVR
ncbi:MAG: DUF547 domain-containing protein [Alphaproteobacteria bacterium]|nr:DUF547 domain-containing protein [Alphaproteobacteria bacterium]